MERALPAPYAQCVDATQNLRQRFEQERRRAAFLSFLPATGVGIIAADSLLAPWAGVPGGLAFGGFAYLLVYAYETLMWRRHHGRA